jgi:hypothetical protein
MRTTGNRSTLEVATADLVHQISATFEYQDIHTLLSPRYHVTASKLTRHISITTASAFYNEYRDWVHD